MEDLQMFQNDDLGLEIGAVYNKDGSISFKAEGVAKGLGFVQEKNGKMYVKWERMNGYLTELGFSPNVGKGDFIQEQMCYMLAMKANNQNAQKFQRWLAFDVIPSIRKHGAFIADSENIDEDFIKNELRFSQKRTIKSFAKSNVSDIKKLYAEFKEYVDSEYKYKTDDRVARYKSVEKGLQQLHDELAKEPDNVGDCYNVRKLKEQVILDRTTLEKRISGGIRASQTRLITQLTSEDDEDETN